MDGFFGEINRVLDRYLTPAVKTIFLINVGVTLLLIVMGTLTGGRLVDLAVNTFSLTPWYVIHGAVWQFVTYMFLQVEVMHVVFNMLGLWLFAPDLEQRWGTRRFWRFYLITGTGAGVIHFVVTMLLLLIFHRHYELGPLLGASGAIYGVILVYAAYNPESMILLWGVVPIKAKYFALIMGVLTFTSTASGQESSISNLTHLAGLLVAYVYVSIYHREWNIRRWRWR